uniref:M56 family metallopeptidase n=1 Tax=Eisenbergiella sp. TaxID=1924109 RepID=UPI003AB197D3
MDVLVKMSVSGAVLIAVIVIVRALAVNRLPKKAFLWLWAAAFFCLMIPVRLPSPISVYRPSGQLERLAVRPGLLLSEAAGQAASEASGAAAVMASHLSVWHGIWIAGAVLLAAFFLVGHLRGRRVYSASLPVEQPFARTWLEEKRIRRPVQIRYSDRIESPLTYGFLWPVLLVPADMDWADEETAAFILSHEMSHIRRFDAFTKWLLAAALCIH